MTRPYQVATMTIDDPTSNPNLKLSYLIIDKNENEQYLHYAHSQSGMAMQINPINMTG